jgi:hypothetical protein
MGFITELLKLSDQYGLTPVLAIMLLVGGFFLARGVLSTWNYARHQEAQGQNQIDNSIAGALKDLANSNNLFSQRLGEMAVQNNAIINAASTERLEQSRVLTRTLDRMEGMLSVMDRTEKGQRMISNTLNEVNDRMQPMQTDLKEVNLRTAGLESTFAKQLEERFAPVIALLIGMNGQLNGLVAAAQSSGQSVEKIVQEAARITQSTTKIIEEFLLMKDMIFDRDDRLADILISNNIKAPTREKDSPHDTSSPTLPAAPDLAAVGAPAADLPGGGPGGNADA